MNKKCSRCKQEKLVSEFCKSSRMRDGFQSACKTCMNDSYNRSRNKDKQRYQQVQVERQRRNVLVLNTWKEQQRCCLCNEDDSSCLDLHHLDPNQKDIEVSNVVRMWRWERLMTEIIKCVVVCRNCHGKIHAGKITLLSKGHI